MMRLLIGLSLAIGCGSRTGLNALEQPPPTNDASDDVQAAPPVARDAATGVKACNVDTCPIACCEGTPDGGTRQCVRGLDPSACGIGGLFCSNCGMQRCAQSPDHKGGFCQ